jgi:beta-fructofuranosidase
MKTTNAQAKNPTIRLVLTAAAVLICAGALRRTHAAEPNLEDEIKQTEQWVAAANKLRERLYNDPDHPTYHFMPREAWMNDINGCIFWKGRYHIFYQYNPEGAYWKLIQWGHASSTDLVHWVHHPVVMATDPKGPDREGVYSGGAFFTKEGVPAFIYHGRPDGTCIATADDDMLIKWTKHPANPVIKVPRKGDPGYGKYIVYDPCAWLYKGTYYALVGNRVAGGGKGDTTYLFKSQDLVNWQFVCRFYESKREWTHKQDDCAVPDFFPMADKWMLLFTSHLSGTQYYLGTWQGRQFTPESHGWMHWPGGHMGGPRTMLDGKGRRLFFDWIREVRGRERERASGWSGLMTLPRILSLRTDGTLAIEPVPEIEVLRYNRRTYENILIGGGPPCVLADPGGDTIEIEMEIEPRDAAEFGIAVRRAPDGVEKTTIACIPSEKTLKVVVAESSLDESIKYRHYRSGGATRELLPEDKWYVKAQKAPFELADGENLKLRVFLDKSVIEVFANGQECITQRIHPTRPDSMALALFSRGGEIMVKSLKVWDMAPANSY